MLTSFPVRQQGFKGRLGTNQISRLNLSIPTRRARLLDGSAPRATGSTPTTVELHGTDRVPLRASLRHAVRPRRGRLRRPRARVGARRSSGRPGRPSAITGSPSTSADPDAMITLPGDRDRRGRRRRGWPGSRWRLGAEPHRVGFVELVEDRDSEPGTRSLGEGTVHHCAWDVPDAEAQMAVKQRLDSLGYNEEWIGPRDRTYFVSVYNRTPSGALFEYAWSKPELWTVDEPAEELGQTYQVPPHVPRPGRHDSRLPRAARCRRTRRRPRSLITAPREGDANDPVEQPGRREGTGPRRS